jgi:hypothetical protein
MKIDQPGQGITPDFGGSISQDKSLAGTPLANINNDSVERFQSLVNLYDNFLNVSAQSSGGDDSPTEYNAQLLQDMQKDVDQRMQQAQLAGPSGSDSTTGSTWGQGLRDLSQKGLEAGYNAAKGAAKYSDNDKSFPFNDSSSTTTGKEKMPDNLTSLGNWGKGTTIAEGSWHAAEVGAVNWSDSGDWGSGYAKGATDFLNVQGRVYGDAGFKDWTVSAGIGVQGRVELVGSHYEIGYTTPSIYNLGGHPINLNTKVNADASVGVTGDVHAEIGIGKNTHIAVGAGGFSGASASLAGQVGVSDFGNVHGSATAWAGVGAKVDVSAGFSDGKFSFDFGAGLALGIGAELDWGFTIDFYAIGDSLYNAAAEAWDWVGDAGDWVAGAAGDVADAVGDAAEAVGDAAQDTVNAVEDAAGDVADAVGDAAGAVGDAVSDVCDW